MTGRLYALFAIGCLLTASILYFGAYRRAEPVVASTQPPLPAPGLPGPRRSEAPRTDDLVAIVLAQPLFSPARRPPAAAATEEAPVEGAPDFRLAGIVMEPDRRLAIFAAANAKPLAVEEGGQVYGWHVDSISPGEVSMSGPAGTRIMQPKTDRAPKGPAPPPMAPTTPAQPRKQNVGPPVAATTVAPRSPLAGGPPSPITFPLTSSSFPPSGAPRPRQ